MPYGSASSVECARFRASLSTVSPFEIPASSVRKYRTPPEMLIFESASAGAAAAARAPTAPARASSTAGVRDVMHATTLPGLQTFGAPMPDADTPGVIAPPPLIYLVGLGAGFLLEA